MNSKSAQWTLWALVMLVFTGLTLAGRWLDLALVMTIVGVLWYGIVPKGTSRDNGAEGGVSLRKR